MREMRKITAGGLSKILEENYRWHETDEEEGEVADLSNANLIKAELSGLLLSGANLSGADLSGAHMPGVDLASANLCRASLIAADLSGAELWYADLSGASLSGAHLREAHLDDTNLSHADLSGADLFKTDLRGANLSGADLSGADLRGACLNKADLSEADLSGADLSGADLRKANLTRVRGLTIEQISVVKTLYGAKLNLERTKQVRKKYPHLLEESEKSVIKKVTLRSSYKTLSVSEVQSMPNVSIREKYDYGFYGYSKIIHHYHPESYLTEEVVEDNATGLMWCQSGFGFQVWRGATDWVEDLKSDGYAGYNDWRLPTLEEAVSLLESSKMNGGLYIDPVFSKKWWTWTGDKCEDGEGSEVAWGVHFYFGRVNWVNVNDECVSVRPVRTMK